jgi:cytochrome c oxidase subunit 2
MSKEELIALIALFIIVVGFPIGVFAYQRVYLPASYGDVKVINLVAQVPKAGGWSPEVITVNKGDTVQLRITSPDVVHGFAIGGMGIDAGQILPGKVTTVQFVADKAGQFTFYCNVWCSPFHYRMRGTLEVVDPTASGQSLNGTEGSASTFEDLDIDAPHEAEFYPLTTPSATRGQALAAKNKLPVAGDLRSQSPSAVFQTIEGSTEPLSDEEIWDLVAHLWSTTTTPERLTTGKALYAKNCASCHGEEGAGDGPGKRYLEHEPTDFTAAKTMAGGTSEIYYAKIRRGGMGTGMPYWGTIFGEEETWSLVDYLWTFMFEGYPFKVGTGE